MAEESTPNTYEEARRQQLLENKKRFEDLGILKISKRLTDLSKLEKSMQRKVKPKIRNGPIVEPRRSSRARNPVPSYRDDVDIGLPPLRKKSRFSSSWASYLARPLEQVKTASYEERVHAMKCAEKLQTNLQSDCPSFVKSMLRSHVYSCFWLGLPTRFCEDHLPKSTTNMVLEDEDGNEYNAVFISERTGLSGGWRAFALEHKLDDGDALVFELVEPTRFKVYTVKASCSRSEEDDFSAAEEDDADAKKASTATKEPGKSSRKMKTPSGQSIGRPPKTKKSKKAAMDAQPPNSPTENGQELTGKGNSQAKKTTKAKKIATASRSSARLQNRK